MYFFAHYVWPAVTKNEIEVAGLNSLSPWEMSQLASFGRNQHHSAWMFKTAWHIRSPSNENWKIGDQVLFWLSSLLAARIQTVPTKMKRVGELRAVSFKMPIVAKQCSFFHCDGCIHQSHVDVLASLSSTSISPSIFGQPIARQLCILQPTVRSRRHITVDWPINNHYIFKETVRTSRTRTT